MNHTIESFKEFIDNCPLIYDKRHKKVLSERLDGKSLREIGENLYENFQNSRHNNLGVSQERIRQLEAGGIRRLRIFLRRGRQVVICAAVKTEDEEIIRGHRHSDCIQTIIRIGKKPSLQAEAQGFITSWGHFVTREEGRKLQDAAGIPSEDPNGYHGTTLFSEDLY